MTPETQSPSAMPLRKWAIARRWLRYATLAILGTMFCVTLVFWIRSYWRIDHLHGFLWGEHRLFVRSGGGELVFSEYKLMVPAYVAAPYQSWETRTFVISKKYEIVPEFGIQVAESIASASSSQKPVRMWWSDPVLRWPKVAGPFGSPTLDLAAHGVAFPHLLLLLIIGSLFFLVLRRWQFSLHAFFIWVTIICIAMACAVAFATAVKEISVYPSNPIKIL